MPDGITWHGGVDATGRPDGHGVMACPTTSPVEYTEGVMAAGLQQGQWVSKYRDETWMSFQFDRDDSDDEGPDGKVHCGRTPRDLGLLGIHAGKAGRRGREGGRGQRAPPRTPAARRSSCRAAAGPFAARLRRLVQPAAPLLPFWCAHAALRVAGAVPHIYRLITPAVRALCAPAPQLMSEAEAMAVRAREPLARWGWAG